jgi:hypothetical protein
MRRSAFHFELFFPSPFGASGAHQASVVRRMSVNRHVAGSKSGPGSHHPYIHRAFQIIGTPGKPKEPKQR